MTVSAASYTCDVEITYQLQDCGAVSASLVYRHNSSKEGSAGLATPPDVLMMSYFGLPFAHNASRVAQANWRPNEDVDNASLRLRTLEK